jgi:hypothetical protein
MPISVEQAADANGVGALTGQLADQAALQAIPNGLYTPGWPILTAARPEGEP